MKTLTQHRWVQGWDVNARGWLFGGRLLAWVDEDVMMVATINAMPRSRFLTRGMAAVNFLNQSCQGELLKFEHRVVYVGKTSIWIYSEVFSDEIPDKIFTSYTALVAVDMNSKSRLIKDCIDVKLLKSVPHDEHWNYVEVLKQLHTEQAGHRKMGF